MREAARNETIAYGCYVLIYRRYFTDPASPTVRANIAALLNALGYSAAKADPTVIDVSESQK